VCREEWSGVGMVKGGAERGRDGSHDGGLAGHACCLAGGGGCDGRGAGDLDGEWVFEG
jgi:hypothetical protein